MLVSAKEINLTIATSSEAAQISISWAYIDVTIDEIIQDSSQFNNYRSVSCGATVDVCCEGIVCTILPDQLSQKGEPKICCSGQLSRHFRKFFRHLTEANSTVYEMGPVTGV